MIWCRVWVVVFFVQQKTAYEMRISDWSSDVCSSDLNPIYLGYDNRENDVGVYTLDEVAIYNFPLSAARVQAHFAAGAAPGPVQTLLNTSSPTKYFRRPDRKSVV